VVGDLSRMNTRAVGLSIILLSSFNNSPGRPLLDYVSMAVDLHKYYFRYIVRIFGYIYVIFVFPEIKTA